MPNRSRFASRLTLWAFAAALVLKSAVPMLAAVAAGLQGKAVADICDVYGVAMTPPAIRDAVALAAALEPMTPMAHGHGAAHDHVHGDAAAPAPAHDDAPASGHRHGGASGDHCALTGMVAIGAGGAAALAGLVVGDASHVLLPPRGACIRDAAARWAALLGHGPPAFS